MRIKSLSLPLAAAILLLVTSASSAGEGITLENVVSPGPNRANESLAEKFSMQQAVRFLDSASLTWQKQRKCFACHSKTCGPSVPLTSAGRLRDVEFTHEGPRVLLHPGH